MRIQGPWRHGNNAGGGAGSVKVIVSNLDYDSGKAIVEEFGAKHEV